MNTYSQNTTPHTPRIRVERMTEYPTGRDKTLISLDGDLPAEIIGSRVGYDLQLFAPLWDARTSTRRVGMITNLLPHGLTHDEAVTWFVGAIEAGLSRESEWMAVAA